MPPDPDLVPHITSRDEVPPVTLQPSVWCSLNETLVFKEIRDPLTLSLLPGPPSFRQTFFNHHLNHLL